MKRDDFGIYIIIVLVIANLVIYSEMNLIGKKTLLSDVHVEEERSVGFNVDTDALHFGHIGRGLKAKRTINISNTYNFSIIVKISNEQNKMQNWLNFEKDFQLDSNKSRFVEIGLDIPENAKKGYHKNLLTIKYYKG